MKFPELENLDKKTIQLLDELKKEFQSEIKDDFVKQSDWFMIRFLIARKMDLKDTKKMLNEYFVFRKSCQEQYQKKAFMDLKKLKEEFYLVIKTSKNNNPLLVYQLGKNDLVDYFKKLDDIQPLLNSIVYVFDIMYAVVFPIYSQHYGKRIDKVDLIMDMNNVPMFQLYKGKFKTFLKSFIQIFQESYPETAGNIVAINLPKFFSIIWQVVKLLLDERTKSRMFIFSNKKDGIEGVKNLIQDHELPPEYGGKCEDFHTDTMLGQEEMYQTYLRMEPPQTNKEIFDIYFRSNREKKQIYQLKLINVFTNLLKIKL